MIQYGKDKKWGVSLKFDTKWLKKPLLDKKGIYFALVCLLVVAVFAFLTFSGEKIHETEDTTFGIDVARYQGTINWSKVAQSDVDFVMIRLGYRGLEDGVITEDSNARYNLQEAQKYGIPMGAYFFSTAVSEEEAVEEAQWVADLVSQYSITYPIAYDCELFTDPSSRQYGMNREERMEAALAFLKEIEHRGYEGMFYSSKYDMEEGRWDMERIEKDYKIWVAQYPETPYPDTPQSSYSGTHAMWQYTRDGEVFGVPTAVDMNVAYFGYDGIREPKNATPAEEAYPDPEALMDFDPVNEEVTAKEEVNLRDMPSQGEEATVLTQLKNGEVALRTGVSESGWSRLELDGNVYYAVSSYLTTDLAYNPTAPIEVDGIETVFQPVNEKVTAKNAVNLRTIPSVEHEDSKVVVKIKHGDVVTRIGINQDVGWSQIEYDGQILYCISSYVEVVK